jgi:CheY-like chemotaxis protein
VAIGASLPRNLRILIADDMAMNRKILERKLTAMQPFEGLNYTCQQVSTGEEAVRRVCEEGEEFDLILMDQNFDHSTGGNILGSDACRAIRKHEMEKGITRGIPIIACTGNCTESDAHLYLQAGMDKCWGKPIPNPTIIATDIMHLFSTKHVHKSSTKRNISAVDQ